MTVDITVNSRIQANLIRGHASRLRSPGLAVGSVVALTGVSRAVTTAMARGAAGTSVQDLLAAGFEALDLLNIGLVVCAGSGQLLVANRTAEQILSRRDGLELGPDGVLSTTEACTPSVSQLLQAAIAAQPGDAGASDSALAVRRASGKRALTLLIRPANGASLAAQHSTQPAALVMILDSALPANTVEAELRQLYDLTRTETLLANLLMEGKSLDDCGRELGIRRSTVRMHLRNLFAKTGVRRQSELVSLLLKSIGLGPREK